MSLPVTEHTTQDLQARTEMEAKVVDKQPTAVPNITPTNQPAEKAAADRLRGGCIPCPVRPLLLVCGSNLRNVHPVWMLYLRPHTLLRLTSPDTARGSSASIVHPTHAPSLPYPFLYSKPVPLLIDPPVPLVTCPLVAWLSLQVIVQPLHQAASSWGLYFPTRISFYRNSISLIYILRISKTCLRFVQASRGRTSNQPDQPLDISQQREHQCGDPHPRASS